MTNHHWQVRVAALFLMLLLFGCDEAGQQQAGDDALNKSTPTHLSMRTLSNQPHLLSGGDVLVEIIASADQPEDLLFALNDQHITPEIQKQPQEGELKRYIGLITGLKDGVNSLHVEAGSVSAQLPLINYSISGPIFSGPQQQPYFCLSQLNEDANGNKRRFAIGNGDFLADTAADAQCTLSSRIDYVYMSSEEDAGFKPFDNDEAIPADLAYVSNADDETIPYIVRIDTGTINRAIYQIALLHSPSTNNIGTNSPSTNNISTNNPSTNNIGTNNPSTNNISTSNISALSPSQLWNNRLIYTFGGGCEAGYVQGNTTGGVLQDMMLRKGYAVASSTLNVNAQGGCNDVVSAETAMMVKEYFIETYGEPVYTIGSGGSGGAMQQLLIAGAYPGILNGLLPSLGFADAVSYFTDAQECASLLRDFVADPARAFDDDIKNVIGGWSMWSVCDESLGERPKRVGPDDCSALIPPSAHYHPQSNPQGVRCSIYDGMKNVFQQRQYEDIGVAREFAQSPHDNVGVQYGLAALNEGSVLIKMS